MHAPEDITVLHGTFYGDTAPLLGAIPGSKHTEDDGSYALATICFSLPTPLKLSTRRVGKTLSYLLREKIGL